MKIRLSILLIILVTYQGFLRSQESFNVTKAPFSSQRYDEFSPVYYKNGIVFCSNRNKSQFINYSGSDNKGSFKIYFADTISNFHWTRSKLFSKDITSRLNDGPATFSQLGDTIYFSRNMRTEGKLRELEGTGNNLGIFSSVFEGKKWSKASELRFNNQLYNFSTPCLSPDGTKLFFASDRSGGFGGSDIYYSQWKNGYWNDPVNMGPIINSKGNESYPFMNEAGELFFSSDGQKGMGGKDIFVTKQLGSGWYPSVRLDSPINSEYDDFGIVTDSLMKEGYFSSKREKTIDIYKFSSNTFQFWFSEVQKENQYCLTISDTGQIQVDTIRFQYLWDFGDGTKLTGKTVSHCFSGNGKYEINLDLIDKRSGKLFFRKLTYDLEVFNIDQPFIAAQDVAIAGEPVELNGQKSYCPGYSITGYFWDFGDGSHGNGENISHKYTEAGEFGIKMGLTLKSQVSGKTIKRVVSKKIIIFSSEQERATYVVKTPSLKENLTDIRKIENMKVNRLYSAENDIRKEALYQVVLLSSASRIPINSATFKNLPVKYVLKESFEPETGQYYYIIDRQMTLMAAYPAYNDVITAGFKNAVVRLFVLNEPVEIDMYIIRKNYSLLADGNFDAASRMTTNAYILLDQIVSLMNKYPSIKLEIGVHTDNQGVQANLTAISQFRAQVLVNHLVTRGINVNRLVAKGYGGTRPITTNNSSSDRSMNRRIDFLILN
jgi:outer membrane protein OmpA-like peptidoglycan-associated protein